MKIELIKKEFEEYIKKYNTKDEKIKLKYEHSYRVMELMSTLAERLGLTEEEKCIAELIGLLHDIGRFEQIKKYDTFNDNISIDHADRGANYLIKEGNIRKYIAETKYDEIIDKAIRNHNKKEIDKNIKDEKELLFTKMIRDCDKIDIFKTNSMEDTMIFDKKEITEEVLKDYYNEKIIDLKKIETKADSIIVTLAFIFDFNYKEGYRLLEESKNFELYRDGIIVKKGSEKLWKEIIKIHENRLNENIYKAN